MSIITHKFRTSNTGTFKDDFVNSNYYVFASSTNISQTKNTDFSKNEFLENTLFGKKVDPNDVFYAIDNNRWIIDVVYNQYDNTVDLLDKKFYVIVYPSDNNTGNYEVYKCLFNNHGVPSKNPPNYDPIVPNQIYRTPDGYIWKYMYSISAPDFQKYSAIGYAPIIGTSSANAVYQSSIDHIEVENYELNKGYELIEGTITENLVAGDDIVISSPILSEIANYYTGQNFYVYTDSTAQVYTINKYTYIDTDGVNKRAKITLLNKNSFITVGYKFKIFPRIEIKGDGTGALAIPNVNSLGEIKSILVLNGGSGYTRATARVVTPEKGFDTISAVSTDVEATLRPILSPTGGHATNFAEELLSRRAIIYLELTDTDNISIPSTNRYTKLGLVKNPEFTAESNTAPELFDNRLVLGVDSDVFTVGEIVTQKNNGNITFAGEVHQTGSGVIYLCNYHGPYQNYEHNNDGYYDISFDTNGINDDPPTNRPIISSQNQTVNINNFIRPPYVQKTGELYYMTIFSPITRTSTSNEEYKIILEF